MALKQSPRIRMNISLKLKHFHLVCSVCVLTLTSYTIAPPLKLALRSVWTHSKNPLYANCPSPLPNSTQTNLVTTQHLSAKCRLIKHCWRDFSILFRYLAGNKKSFSNVCFFLFYNIINQIYLNLILVGQNKQFDIIMGSDFLNFISLLFLTFYTLKINWLINKII